MKIGASVTSLSANFAIIQCCWLYFWKSSRTKYATFRKALNFTIFNFIKNCELNKIEFWAIFYLVQTQLLWIHQTFDRLFTNCRANEEISPNLLSYFQTGKIFGYILKIQSKFHLNYLVSLAGAKKWRPRPIPDPSPTQVIIYQQAAAMKSYNSRSNQIYGERVQ